MLQSDIISKKYAETASLVHEQKNGKSSSIIYIHTRQSSSLSDTQVYNLPHTTRSNFELLPDDKLEIVFNAHGRDPQSAINGAKNLAKGKYNSTVIELGPREIAKLFNSVIQNHLVSSSYNQAKYFEIVNLMCFGGTPDSDGISFSGALSYWLKHDYNMSPIIRASKKIVMTIPFIEDTDITAEPSTLTLISLIPYKKLSPTWFQKKLLKYDERKFIKNHAEARRKLFEKTQKKYNTKSKEPGSFCLISSDLSYECDDAFGIQGQTLLKDYRSQHTLSGL